MNSCQVCGRKTKRRSNKYCSNKCQAEDRYNKYIERWKSGQNVLTKNISRYIRRYLVEKLGNKCQICGWHEINLVTGRVPLEVDHISGNSKDISESNLRLICPNCHSLSPNFRNLNKGKGRVWRKEKYIRVKK